MYGIWEHINWTGTEDIRQMRTPEKGIDKSNTREEAKQIRV